MNVTCPRCSWPDPTPISAHGAVRYWRCLCGQWLVTEAGTLAAAPGLTAPADHVASCGRSA